MKHLYNEDASEVLGDPNGTLERIFSLTLLLGDYMAKSLAERGLTRSRATVVWSLFHEGPMTQRQLSQILKVTPRNVTGLLDGLEATGFVVRSPHATDRRATTVTITEKGRTAAQAMHQDHAAFASILFSDVTPEALSSFDETLRQIVGRLTAEVTTGTGDVEPDAVPAQPAGQP
jgi:DNA-binding MarR family transcriptional regulator